MSSYKALIDVTKLGDIIREHPQLVREKEMKDGKVHKFVSVDINERREVSESGATHYIKVNLWKLIPREGMNYYLADVYPNNFEKKGVINNNTPQFGNQTPPEEVKVNSNGSIDNLPF